MGYAGNTEPDYIIPSVIGVAPPKGVAAARKGAEVCRVSEPNYIKD